ncbi:dedicator of cytokinesis protein 9 isoform X3 [Octopus sinensis]|uniref:Dedicator of cytokinesis protein 9 isoform X3 n=1 Tax=Octopus sinensis TaxID=2607531 RepID=A0A7E6FHZ7_9MOLL|nr:dedicator of cytokinesis protein 9 isoform X3 [Octopus sinensis]
MECLRLRFCWRRVQNALPVSTTDSKHRCVYNPNSGQTETSPTHNGLLNQAPKSPNHAQSQSRPPPVDPVDYETYVVKNKVLLHNDPQRELLIFPFDDVVIPPPHPRQKSRTICSSVPKNASKEATTLLVRECLKTYTSDCHIITYNYNAYSGSYQQLPNKKKLESLPEQVFEIDVDTDDKDEDSTLNRNTVCSITKEGWLFKGPEGQKDNIISFTRQFKRRYFCLKQQTDFTYILEFYKAEKKSETKGAIYLETASDVIKHTKKGKYCFELQMQDRRSYLLAAENEAELVDWMTAFKAVINANETSSQASTERSGIDEECPTPTKSDNHRLGLENSMHPELVKYSRETDTSLAKARQEERHNLFALYPDMTRFGYGKEEEEVYTSKDVIDVFPKALGQRFLLRLQEFQLKLQANVSDDDCIENHQNPEPFFISFALYDAKAGKKITEDFYVDPNSLHIRSMIPSELLHASDRLHTVDGVKNTAPELYKFDEKWFYSKERRAVFSVTGHPSNIYLYAKIEKVLQGSISHCTEHYMKSTDTKVGTKIHRQMKLFCSRIGHHRMPFAWTAKCVSPQATNDAKMVLYRQESSKLSEEEIIKRLQEMRRPEKQSKWQVIPGHLKILIEPIESPVPNCVTPSLLPLHPFPEPPVGNLHIEIEEFQEDKDLSSPFTCYQNLLFVYPISLKYDCQKTFTKARNIACCIELRDSDDDGAIPLRCIYGRPGMSVFTTVASATVLHHNTFPEFSEEVKINLPTQLHDKHHLLFRFYHVSCESSKTSPRNSSASSKKKDNIETAIGYAWLPLLRGGKLASENPDPLPIAANLPAGYLSHDMVASGKVMCPEIKWVDGKKELLKVNLRLKSTIYTKDQHLYNFFVHCQKLENNFSPTVESETTNKLKPENGRVTDDAAHHLNAIKSLHAVEVSTFINFLPTILNQLFRLIARTHNEDIAMNAARVLIHIVSEVNNVGKPDILQAYVKYVFKTLPSPKGTKVKTVHEELAKNLTVLLRPINADQSVVSRFLKHSWFFFEILIKSMAQYLIETERIKMPRNERFSSDYQFRIQNLIQAIYPHLYQKQDDISTDASTANHSLATFIKHLFTLIDRGFVFRIISTYMENFSVRDTKVFQQMKFEFLRIVCSHEHYIPLCLPLMRRGLIKNYKDVQLEDLKHDYTLSEEYRKNHYLAGLLLQELKIALYDSRDIHRCAITVLRNQIAKHAFDSRYCAKGHQGRIAALYLPLIPILLESKERLMDNADSTTAVSSSTQNIDLNASTDGFTNSDYHHKSISGIDQIHKRDSSYFDVIAGRAPPQSVSNLNLGEPEQLELLALQQSNLVIQATRANSSSHSHLRTQSVGGPVQTAPFQTTMYSRYDKLDTTEVKDLLICFLHILKYLPEDILLGWFNNSSEFNVLDLFSLLELCLYQFRYVGKRKILTLGNIGDTRKAMTAPQPSHKSFIGASSNGILHQRTYSQCQDSQADLSNAPGIFNIHRALQEANISTEVGIIVLDVLSLYSNTFKKQLEHKDGDNNLMKKIFEILLSFLQTSQSETLQKHIFSIWRSFIRKFQAVLFRGNAKLCGDLCYEILRCCNSRLSSTRKEACALLYLLMRSNFEYSRKTSFTRVHLQVIISVSQLIGDVVGISNSYFQESLVMVNNYAKSDKAMQKTNFPLEVKDLTKRIRTVLMATAQLKEHEKNPEMLVDLQYCLAKSYASTPELRKTWLESMAKAHLRTKDYSEAAHCYLHISALVSEYLRRRGTYPQGCAAFHMISPNIQIEESSIKDDSGMQDVHYTDSTLIENLEQAARIIEQAERYEVLGDIYKLIIPMYEVARDFERLSETYRKLFEAYNKIVEVMHSGKRLLGKYYRVAFYGQAHFDEENGKEYIYKEPKVTNLSEICDRLFNLYTYRYGKENVKLIMDSKKVNVDELDPKYAFIQVTYVTPYFTKEESKERLTEFERNNNIQRFMFETPFTKNGPAHGSITEQYKLRTILTTSHTFPYVKKRIEIIEHMEQELSPIEVAIDELHNKVIDLQEVVRAVTPDVKKLHLNLQGCVSTQVHAGPLAYAEAFLSKDKVNKYPVGKVAALKDVFKNFIHICSEALDLNAKLIETEQKDYHESLKAGFNEIYEKLGEIVGDKHFLSGRYSIGSLPGRHSASIISLLNSTSGASTV